MYEYVAHAGDANINPQVTIIAACAAQVRVTQSYLDLEKQRIVVHMTEIIDLDGGWEGNRDEILKLLSWLMATPVGITT